MTILKISGRKYVFLNIISAKSLFYIQTESYENIIHQRRQFLESLRNCYELQSSFIKCAKDAIIERKKRREVDEANQAVSIIARKRHSPQILEVQLPDAFQENSKLLKLICVDCTSFCQHPNAVHV